MKKRHLNAFCFAALVFGGFSGASWAQDACRISEQAACCATETGQPVAAALTLPLRGLSDETQPAFGKALRSVGRDVFECSGHPGATQDQPGACGACAGAALSKRHVPAFQSMALEVSGMAQACRVELTPGETVRLSAITSALEGCNVSLDLDQMRLDGNAVLHLVGLTCGGCEGRAVAALETLEGVTTSSCTFGSVEDSVVALELADSAAMNYGRLQQAVSGAGFRLADVSWTGSGKARAEPEYDLGLTGFVKRLGARSELLIHGLVPGGAAEKAGLEQGDRILTLNGGVAFEFTREELSELLSTPEPIALAIERGDETFTIKVTPQLLVDDGAAGAGSESASAKDEPKKKPTRGLPIGTAAPAIVAEDLDGIPFKLADYRGKVTVVTYWGFW